MSKETKGVNIRLARKQYAELVTKKQKGEFLDQFCAATGMHRKSALRCFSQKERPHLKRGRPVTSGPAAKALLSRIWKLAGRPCSKLLKPMLRTWVDSLRDAGEVLDDGVVAELLGHHPVMAVILVRLSSLRVQRRPPLPATCARPWPCPSWRSFRRSSTNYIVLP